jgi:AcrR family transcriptional regulator
MTTGEPGPGAADVVWLRQSADAPRRRGEALTRGRIVVAAVSELDEHGAERLTMRRLAQRLEVTSTALYWHVATKEDLLDLAVDHAVGEVPLPDAAAEPRVAVSALLLGWRTAMLAHPWSPALLGRPQLGPNVLARTEFLQAALVRAGLSGIDLASATRVLVDFVIGSALGSATWQRADPALPQRARTHIAEREDLYPTLNAHGFVARRWTDDDLFGRGLDRVLDALLPPDDQPRARPAGRA